MTYEEAQEIIDCRNFDFVAFSRKHAITLDEAQ